MSASWASWRWRATSKAFFFCKQKTAYEILASLEFRRVLFRSRDPHVEVAHRGVAVGREHEGERVERRARRWSCRGRGGNRKSVAEGKSVDLGGRRIIKNKNRRSSSHAKRRQRPRPSRSTGL